MNKIALAMIGLFALNSVMADDQLITVEPIKEGLEKIAPYPKAKEGYKRYAIYVPELENEYDAQVEIMFGKTMMIDCNKHMFAGSMESKILEGWGYDYHVLDNISANAISTMMACPPNKPQTEQFVPVKTNTDLMRYNSKLPIVIYAPQDIEVKYRVWNASKETLSAKEE